MSLGMSLPGEEQTPPFLHIGISQAQDLRASEEYDHRLREAADGYRLDNDLSGLPAQATARPRPRDRNVPGRASRERHASRMVLEASLIAAGTTIALHLPSIWGAHPSQRSAAWMRMMQAVVLSMGKGAVAGALIAALQRLKGPILALINSDKSLAQWMAELAARTLKTTVTGTTAVLVAVSSAALTVCEAVGHLFLALVKLGTVGKHAARSELQLAIEAISPSNLGENGVLAAANMLAEALVQSMIGILPVAATTGPFGAILTFILFLVARQLSWAAKEKIAEMGLYDRFWRLIGLGPSHVPDLAWIWAPWAESAKEADAAPRDRVPPHDLTPDSLACVICLRMAYDPVRHQKWISNFACRNCLEVCIRKRNYDPFLGIPAAFPDDYVSHVVAKQCTDEVAVRLNLVRHEYHPLTSSAGVAGAKDKEDGSKGSVSA